MGMKSSWLPGEVAVWEEGAMLLMTSSIVAEEAPGSKPKLLDRIRSLMRARRYSIRTEEAYVDWIRRFILFHKKRHPSEMGEVQVTSSRLGSELPIDTEPE